MNRIIGSMSPSAAFRHFRPSHAASIALLSLAAVACGDASGSSGTVPGASVPGTSSGAVPGTPAAATATSSTAEARKALCEAEISKGCTHDVAKCASELTARSSCWVERMTTCVTALPQSNLDACGQQDLSNCDDEARKGCDPSYPNSNYISACNDRNLECKSTYDPKGSTYSNVGGYCRKLAAVDDAARARAPACITKPCDQFPACISDIF